MHTIKQELEHINYGKTSSTNYEKSHGILNRSNENKKSCLWFIYDVCEKKFSTPLHLIAHRMSCHVETPHVYKICDTSLNFRSDWNTHLKRQYFEI